MAISAFLGARLNSLRVKPPFEGGVCRFYTCCVERMGSDF